MSTLRPVLPPWSRARPSWRALLALTAAVALLHLALLGGLSVGGQPEELPLAHRFSTRTIVIAPPAATGGGAPAAAPPAAPAAASGATARLREKPREARPVPERKPKPRPVPPPEPAAGGPAPQPRSEPPREPDPLPVAPEPPVAEPAPEPAEASVPLEPAPAAAPAPAEPGPGRTGMRRDPPGASGTGAGSGQGGGEGAGAGGGVPGAREPLQVPGSVRLDFAVTGQQGAQPLSGVFGELVWLHDGRSYNARLALRVLFRTLRTQTSVGQLSAGGIEPTRFSDARRSEVATHFVRESGQIVFSSNAPAAPLMPGAQDRLSVILQLSALLAGDPARHGPGSHFSIQTAGPRDAEIWQFSVDGDETLETPAGTYAARKLTRLPRKEFDQKIELWLAPELGWLPVRIRQTQANGDFADMQLRQAGAP
ncbi:DUF3108 domain-containing protein [Xenophilus sp. Marseille-Q4582]|uniref:DUF3108 domain-containing protein n=1 Tax=Xenophilus sp. Marseille-Q4582 TaxID=2866600 RepID=UPI001CE422B5|nr:DUF3108 domain-containing protein [Xenophilus sp. Marseille-Q4582]